jgi:hypothetical protein
VQKIFLRQLEVAEPTDEVSGSSININSKTSLRWCLSNSPSVALSLLSPCY